MTSHNEPWGENVLVEFDDGIAWVTMNRPEKRNAMNPALNEEMLRVVNALATDDRCGVFVLTGAGESFAAGMDLKEYFRVTDGAPDTVLLSVRRIAEEWQWPQAPRLSEADDRDGQRLVFRRRVHAPWSPAILRLPRRTRCSGYRRSTGAFCRPAT